MADTPIFHEVASEHGIVRAQEVRPLGSVTPIPQEKLLLPSEQGTKTKGADRHN